MMYIHSNNETDKKIHVCKIANKLWNETGIFDSCSNLSYLTGTGELIESSSHLLIPAGCGASALSICRVWYVLIGQ